MRTRLLTDRGTARGRRSPLPTPSASPSARVKTTGRHQVSSSAAPASCSAGSGVLRRAGPAGLARRHRRLLCPRSKGFHDRQVQDRDVARRRSAGSATESWTPTGRAGARTSRWPTDPARRLWIEERIRVLRKVTSKAMLFIAGCTSNHWKYYDLFDAIVLLAAPIAVIPDRVANATTTRTSSPRANARRSSRARPGRAAPPPFGYRRDRHHVSPRRRGPDARDHHSP